MAAIFKRLPWPCYEQHMLHTKASAPGPDGLMLQATDPLPTKVGVWIPKAPLGNPADYFRPLGMASYSLDRLQDGGLPLQLTFSARDRSCPATPGSLSLRVIDAHTSRPTKQPPTETSHSVHLSTWRTPDILKARVSFAMHLDFCRPNISSLLGSYLRLAV